MLGKGFDVSDSCFWISLSYVIYGDNTPSLLVSVSFSTVPVEFSSLIKMDDLFFL